MTLDEIKVLNSEGVEERMAAIKTDMNAEGADIDALNTEVDALVARRAEIKESETRFADLRAKVSENTKAVETAPKMEVTKMTINEVRNSQEYIDAYAKYVKTGKDVEARSILTTNAGVESTAKLPVPEIVENSIKNAWSKLEILDKVTRTNLKGNVKIGVETASTEAQVHAEGTDAPDEEQLTITIVEMVPASIKKWVTVSDEALSLDAGAFLQYIYDELAYRVFKKAEDEAVARVLADKNSLGSVMAPTGALADFINATAKLADGAVNPVIVCTRATEAYYRNLAMAANYAVDPFMGMRVLHNDTLASITGTTVGAGSYGFVGDLAGLQANFPDGDNITYKFDDVSMAEKDLVKIVGRIYAAIEVVEPKRFVALKK